MRDGKRDWLGLLLIILAGSLGIGVVLSAENGQIDERDALERLKTLEGFWRGEGGTIGGESNPVVHEFHVSAGGTVVLEIMDPEGEREVNIYYLDGDDLLMTHYCGGGNQPTLKLERDKASSDMLPFIFSTVTNLEDPAKDRHIHASKLVFVKPDRIESWWTVFKDGREAAVSKFLLERSQGS
jgi:hypothetical protein